MMMMTIKVMKKGHKLISIEATSSQRGQEMPASQPENGQ